MFKFKKEDRVNVPGTAAQGVVLDVVESVPGFPVYTLRWLTSAGESFTGSCGEGDLAAAQPSFEKLPPETRRALALAAAARDRKAKPKRKR